MVVRGDWTSLTVVVVVAIATKKKLLYSEHGIKDKTLSRRESKSSSAHLRIANRILYLLIADFHLLQM